MRRLGCVGVLMGCCLLLAGCGTLDSAVKNLGDPIPRSLFADKPRFQHMYPGNVVLPPDQLAFIDAVHSHPDEMKVRSVNGVAVKIGFDIVAVLPGRYEISLGYKGQRWGIATELKAGLTYSIRFDPQATGKSPLLVEQERDVEKGGLAAAQVGAERVVATGNLVSAASSAEEGRVIAVSNDVTAEEPKSVSNAVREPSEYLSLAVATGRANDPGGVLENPSREVTFAVGEEWPRLWHGFFVGLELLFVDRNYDTLAPPLGATGSAVVVSTTPGFVWTLRKEFLHFASFQPYAGAGLGWYYNHLESVYWGHARHSSDIGYDLRLGVVHAEGIGVEVRRRRLKADFGDVSGGEVDIGGTALFLVYRMGVL